MIVNSGHLMTILSLFRKRFQYIFLNFLIFLIYTLLFNFLFFVLCSIIIAFILFNTVSFTNRFDTVIDYLVVIH